MDDIDDDDDDDGAGMFAEKKVEEEKVQEDAPGKSGGLILKVRKYDLSITYDFYT